MAKKCLRSNTCRNKRGFTLIELLIVVAIIAVLGAASVGFYGNYIEDAKIAVRRTNMKLVNDSIANYYKNNNMTYPKYIGLDTALSPFMNKPASEILKEACNAEDMNAYFLTMVPPRRNTEIATDTVFTWKSASEIPEDSELRVKEVVVSSTKP